MKKITIFIISAVILVLALIGGYLFVYPKILFSKEYEAPEGLSAEETIKEYFDCIEDGNPAKANALCVEPELTAYSCNTIFKAEAKNIEDYGKTFEYEHKDSYEYREFLVDYTCGYLIDSADRPLWSGDNSIFFALVKETENSDWKIANIYTGP